MNKVASELVCTIEELIAAAESSTPAMMDRWGWGTYDHNDRWAGGSRELAKRLALNGWHDATPDPIVLAREAIELIEKEIPHTTFTSTSDVVGSAVNIAAFNMGIPECMVRPKLMEISRAGRIITLCASNVYSGSMKHETIIKRGATITALALALQDTGHNVEIWADCTVPYKGYNSRQYARVRVLVKGAHDIIDPSRILYMFAHPTSARQLCYRALGTIRGYNASPTNPIEDMEDGTIYMPSLKSTFDVGKLGAERIRQELGKLGLLKTA